MLQIEECANQIEIDTPKLLTFFIQNVIGNFMNQIIQLIAIQLIITQLIDVIL